MRCQSVWDIWDIRLGQNQVLADRPAEQGRQRAAHPTGVGAGEMRARDQRVGGKRAPLIGDGQLIGRRSR
jgi:hypothetical protein